MKLFENHPLKEYNTFGIEAKAKYFVEVENNKELEELLSSELFKSNDHLILGGGSNILFSKDFEGVVIKPNFIGIEVIDDEIDSIFLRCGGGETWDNIVQFAVENGYGGIENLAMIPGTIGAAPIPGLLGAAPMQNIGAYGVELKDVFHCLHAYNIRNGQVKVFDKSECKFAYRTSVFKQVLKNEFIVFSVTLRLRKNSKINIGYKALQQYFEGQKIDNLSVKAIYDAICDIRNSKLPVPEELGSAGSFFKNPVVFAIKYRQLKKQFPEIVGYDQNDGTVKLAAGWLIEKAGWKGKRIGRVGVHEKQALVLVNYGGASGQEIIELSRKVQKSVFEMFEVELLPEVNIV